MFIKVYRLDDGRETLLNLDRVLEIDYRVGGVPTSHEDRLFVTRLAARETVDPKTAAIRCLTLGLGVHAYIISAQPEIDRVIDLIDALRTGAMGA